MVRKFRGIAVMEVAQVGVRTRAQAALAMAAASSATTKKRKLNTGELKFSSSSSYVQLRSRRDLVITPENSVAEDQYCSSPSSDHVTTSCCSSNGSSSLADEARIKFVDLQDESAEVETTSTYNFCRERRETTPSSEHQGESSDDMESTARPSAANSHRRSTVEKMPTDSELEEFFAAAEKDIQKSFAEKYNYDIVKDVPLEGRYEWVRLKP